jgi:hypothetical protein
MKTSPLKQVKDRFTTKEKAVSAVEKLATDKLWVDRLNEDKGLAHISNAQLLRLHDTLSQVQEKFGSRDALIDEIRKLERRVKDDGYRARLARFPTPRLWDHYRSVARRVSPTSEAK